MYIDLIVLVVVLLLIVIFFRNFSAFIYGFVIVDLILRSLTLLKDLIPALDIKSVMNKYIPESIPGVVSGYLKGIPYNIFLWIYLIIYIIFITYIIRTFVKKRK